MILQEVIPINFGPFSAETKLIVDPEVTVLTGANDSGKSSLLRLVAHICNGTPLAEEDYNHDRQGKIPHSWHHDPEVGCIARFRVAPDTGPFFNHPSHIQVGDVVEIRFSMAPKNSKRSVTEIRRDGAKVGMPMGFVLNELPDFRVLPLSTEIKNTINLKEMNAAESAFVRLGFGGDFAFENFQSFRVERRAFQIGNAQSTLNRLLKKVLPQTMGLQFLLREIGDKPESLTISLIDKHSGFSPVGSRGTGVRKILNVMGTLLTINPERYTYILYDEPETSLHADFQHLLRQLLEELGKNPKIQVIYVTHSPSMINIMRPGAIRVLSRHEINGIATSKIDTSAFADNYIGVRSSLGLSPSDSLLYAPITVVVEGRTEVRCLYLVLNRLKEAGVPGFDDLELLISHAHFLDGNGDSYELLHRLAKSQNVGTILFLDGDKRTQSEKFKRDNPDVEVILLPDQTEFEEIIPHADYIKCLAEFLGDISGEMTEEKFEEWVLHQKWVVRGKKRLAFSKEVEHWVDSISDQSQRYNKPLVMQKAIQEIEVMAIDAKPFQELMESMRRLFQKA